jgi:hypothetical protein
MEALRHLLARLHVKATVRHILAFATAGIWFCHYFAPTYEIHAVVLVGIACVECA